MFLNSRQRRPTPFLQSSRRFPLRCSSSKEWNDPGNTPEEKSVLENAIQRAEFRYIDATKSETDRMLDAIGVARFTTQDIVNAIQAIVFDAE